MIFIDLYINRLKTIKQMNFDTCSKRYLTRFDEKSKPIKNIANFGLNIGERARVTRHGEYYGIEIEAIDKIYPLFNSYRIHKIYQMLLSNDITSIINYANIQDEYMKYGENVIHYIIKKWCEITHVEIPNNINKIELIDNKLDDMIRKNIIDGIDGKFSIVNIGTSEKMKEPILPTDWIGKLFKNANDLHSEMDKLPSRLGKPPVTFCCTYGMMINVDNEKKINLDKINFFFVVNKTGHGLKSVVYSKFENTDIFTNIKKNIKK